MKNKHSVELAASRAEGESVSLPVGDTITFKATARSQKYGDNRIFFEYRILMLQKGKVVGMEDGPRRSTPAHAGAIKAARARIRILRAHRLFAIQITRKHIDDGEARNCNTCAIAQALWHNQERMGFGKCSFSFEVSPYGAWVDPRGIVLSRRYGGDGDDDERRIPANEMPLIYLGGSLGKYWFCSDTMMEWAMSFDDWAESRYMSLREWREEHGHGKDEYPCRPGPCSFVLDLDALTARPVTS